MAFWGAPLPQPQQADLALQAAKTLVGDLKRFCAGLPADLPHFDICIGIHTGTAIVGLLGTEQRLDYTAIADTVNVASRLESATKDYGRILCSADTVALCQQSHALHLIGDIQLKGRTSGIRIYRLGDEYANTCNHPSPRPPALPDAALRCNTGKIRSRTASRIKSHHPPAHTFAGRTAAQRQSCC